VSENGALTKGVDNGGIHGEKIQYKDLKLRASQKVTFGVLLTNQAKNRYILKLLLSAVTARTEALVISGNTFLYSCAKEVCHL
jgi:hypothetical protein